MSYSFFTRSHAQPFIGAMQAPEKSRNKDLDDLIEILLNERKESPCGNLVTLPIFSQKEILRNKMLGRKIDSDGLDRVLRIQKRINELTGCQATQQFAFSANSHGEIGKANIVMRATNFNRLQEALGIIEPQRLDVGYRGPQG